MQGEKPGAWNLAVISESLPLIGLPRTSRNHCSGTLNVFVTFTDFTLPLTLTSYRSVLKSYLPSTAVAPFNRWPFSVVRLWSFTNVPAYLYAADDVAVAAMPHKRPAAGAVLEKTNTAREPKYAADDFDDVELLTLSLKP